MKKLLFTSAVLCLIVAASVGILKNTLAQQTTSTESSQSAESQSASYRISGPYTHKNLSVFLAHGKDLLKGHSFLTLQEALAQKKVIVYETKDVNELSIKNLSNQDIYVQSGDIFRGGDRDRMF